jgi:hypothetical protein
LHGILIALTVTFLICLHHAHSHVVLVLAILVLILRAIRAFCLVVCISRLLAYLAELDRLCWVRLGLGRHAVQ